MRTTDLSPVYQAKGPFATALLDVSRGTENGAHEHELRVRAACDELAAQGADESVVEHLRAVATEPVDRPAPVARLVVANADGVLHDEVAGFQVDDAVTAWGPLPDLARWVEHRDSSLRFVLALVDHAGGDVAVYDSDVPEPEELTSVGQEDHHMNQVPIGGWSMLRYQHYTENVWKENAEAVVDEITSHLRTGNRLVLLAGDAHSRGLVRSALEDTEAELVELETGQRTEDGGDEALQQAIREALMSKAVERRLSLVHELKEGLGRGDTAAAGVDGVADAFVRGQVDTLLIDPAAACEVELDPSRFPGLALGEGLPDGPVRADQALVAAAVLTDASVSACPAAAMGGEPVAALLRWDQQAVGTQEG